MREEKIDIKKGFELHIEGLVQGVGFRPFIYRVATKMGLHGRVENRNNGVFILIDATALKLKEFINRIKHHAPPASVIQSITVNSSVLGYFKDFQIAKSTDTSDEITRVSPDIAVCQDCLDDMERQPHRINYPFINCTNCGPRYTIIKELPYDRPFTTMNSFVMCNECSGEYTNVSDRRFHAQPVACNNCGPRYELTMPGELIIDIQAILVRLVLGLYQGEVFAVKGLGGFHLMCDATNSKAVQKIREIKNRDGKPFALMVKSISTARAFADITREEETLLESWKRPIVLLSYRGGLAPAVTNGLNKVGFMLPYMPFHHQLIRAIQTPAIVLTSGNISDEPIIIDNEKAHTIFKGKVDGILTYNRDIHNRVDDSVCTIMNGKVQVNRRSRGFAPQPFITGLDTEGIFAAGAELVNSFCIGKGNQALMSQYLGDLKNLETLDFYEETYHRFENLFRFKPKLVACDLHSNYLSSQFAQKLADDHKVPLVKIQHHHAHMASVMISNNITDEVIGISFDGIGLGEDGTIWGAEFLKADLNDYQRLYHFENVAMPGSDRASKECWRIAVSYLYKVFGDSMMALDIPLLKDISRDKIQNIILILDKNLNCPIASSAGRLFDAVASIIGVAQANTFQAEAPMKLESAIDKNEKAYYIYEIIEDSISFDSMIRQIVTDHEKGMAQGCISAKFHNTLIRLVVEVCNKISEATRLKKVILSGGTFQNKYLCENVEIQLKAQGFNVYLPDGIPINDQGIALGQLAIAANKLTSLKREHSN